MSKIYQSVCFKKNSLFTFSLFLSLSLSFFFLYCFLSHQYLLFVILSKVFKRNSSFTKKKKFLFFCRSFMLVVVLLFCCLFILFHATFAHSPQTRHRHKTIPYIYSDHLFFCLFSLLFSLHLHQRITDYFSFADLISILFFFLLIPFHAHAPNIHILHQFVCLFNYSALSIYRIY